MSDSILGTLDDTTGIEGQPEKVLGEPIPKSCFKSIVPPYALLFFDHIYSEYLTLKSKIEDPHVIAVLEEIHKKRMQCQLTWSDIYTFDLALVDVRPLESLIRKAYDARAKYRSIAGQKEYDEYLASKPPDLTTILISPQVATASPDDQTEIDGATTSNKDAPKVEPVVAAPVSDDATANSDIDASKSVMLVERVLKADIKYLLSKFYLYYSMLPMREGLRDDLTNRAVRRTMFFVAILVVLMFVNIGGVFVFNFGSSVGLTLLTVAMAGIMGGCVSMLQRIQSAPSEGDALFNLAALNNGWRGLSLSPLYGGIFASLLFVMFAAGVLKGSVFPIINTSKSQPVAQAPETPPATPSPSASSTSATPTGVVSTTSAPSVSVAATDSGVLKIKVFLRETGPADGVAYALLIIWSFLAGFAERLVPDTLNRLVAKNEALQGTNA